MSGGFVRSAASQIAQYKAVESALGTADFSGQLMHYTTFKSLELMATNKTLWFGQVSEMNDPSEFDHYTNGILETLYSLRIPGDLSQVESEIRRRAQTIKLGTYSSSWCEYYESEPSGLLDMWRTYGEGGAGVGIVIDSAQFLPSNITAEKLAFPLNASKVKYIPRSNIDAECNDMFRRLSNVPSINSSPWQVGIIVPLLLAKAPCIKHHSYAPEQEVRFLYYDAFRREFPGLFPPTQEFLTLAKSDDGNRSFLVLPLRDYPEFGINLTPEYIIKRIVVGSNSDPDHSKARATAILEDNGIQGIEVITSDIPMR